MRRIVPTTLIASVAGLILLVGLIDSIVDGAWDHFATFALGLILVGIILSRSTRKRSTVTIRQDLNGWIADHSNRTGESYDVTIDRAVASYRRRVNPAEGHTAVLGGPPQQGREPHTAAPQKQEDSDDDSSGGVTVLLSGEGISTAVAGGKGSALDRLVAAGAPVPATGIITTAAYRRFIGDSDLVDYIDDMVSRGAPEPAEFAAITEAVDNAFLSAPMPADVEVSILTLAHEVKGNGHRLAVRSSATAEDQDAASFAGQYSSFLELEEDDAILEAVRLVWASLWHPAPMAYREHRAISHDTAMAVVVMRLVEATHAGVLFTVDPGGEEDHLRIEYVHGLAEGLVSGTETPEVRVLARTDPPLHDADGPPLADLIKLALDIEDKFGLPQDIEWAFDGHELLLVQARPITTQADRNPDDDGFDSPVVEGYSYTSAGIGEMLPGVLPPLLWSIDGPLIEEGFLQLFSQLGALPPGEELPPVVGRFRGRAALNLDLLKAAAETMPGGTAAEMERQYFGEVVSADLEEVDLSTGFLSTVRELPSAAKALNMRRHLGSDAAVVIEVVERLIGLGIDPEELNQAHLLAYWRRLRALAERVVATQVAVAASAAAAYRGLEMFLEPHVGTDAATLTQRLTAGGIEACGLRTSLDVCDLVVDGLQVPEIRAALETQDADDMRRLLGSTAEGQDFIQRFRARLDQSGSAGVFGGPTWGEDEAGAWNVLRQAAVVELRAGRPEMAPDRAEVLQEVLDRISGTTKWKVTRIMTGQIVDVRARMLSRLVDESVHFLQLREETKLAVLRLGGEARRTIRAMSQGLVDRGVIATVEDAELLDVEELEVVFAGADVDRAVLDRRSRSLATARLVGPLPRIFSGRPERVKAAKIEAGKSVRGWAASPGIHKGRVRVVSEVAEANLEPGDVLVARATDPSWTPIFLTAGALIVEEGGPLSHAAIVARELGLPAVLNVAGATDLFIDGEEITVDGSEGVVLLHRDDPAELKEDAVA